MNRREARERVVQLLYQMDMLECFELDSLERYQLNDFQSNLIDSFLDNKQAIDDIIAKNLSGWSVATIGKVEMACLRLAVNEMYFITDIPEKVAINEAVEMAKTFGDQETYKFVNGVLRTIKNDTQL